MLPIAAARPRALAVAARAWPALSELSMRTASVASPGLLLRVLKPSLLCRRCWKPHRELLAVGRAGASLALLPPSHRFKFSLGQNSP